MMRVRVDEAAERDFSKEFADDCWRRTPRVSPDSWRLSDGLTMGKLWLEGRQVGGESRRWQELQAEGVNGVVASVATLAAWQAVLGDGEGRAACALAVIVDDVAAVPAGVDYVVWRTTQVDEAGLVRLEQAGAAGELRGYGFWVEDVAVLDWAAVLAMAKTAAAQAWGRRKRPSWKILALPLGIGARAALMHPVWQLGEDKVSLLEGAARLDMLVLAHGCEVVELPGGAVASEVAVQPEVAMIQAVARVAEQEAVLVAALGGWPQRQGAEVFSVLRHLQEGVPLWPGMAAWRGFCRQVLPELHKVWGAVAAQQPEEQAEIGGYLKELVALAEGAEAAGLVAWGAAQWRLLAQQRLAAVAPASWQGLNSAEQAAAAVASVPGVTGVVGAWAPEAVARTMCAPNLPDAGVFFAR